MSGQYPVTQTVTPVFPTGQPNAVTVKNTGTVNVYLGGDRSLSALSGYALGPGSAISWDAGKPLFAVCDSGKTTVLSVLDNGGNLFDASAVAAQILQQGLAADIATNVRSQGVPSIFLNTLLDLHAFGNELAVGASINLDVAQYASLNIQLNAFAGTAVVAELDFFQGLGQSGLSTGIWLSNVDTATNATWQIPLNAASIRLTNRGAAALPVGIYGSNRVVPRLTLLGANALPRLLSYSGPLTINTPVNLTAADGGTNSTYFNGPVIITWNTNSLTAPGVTPEIMFMGQDDTVKVTITDTSFTGNHQQTFNHPSVPCKWQLYPNATQTGAIVNMAIFPAQSG